MKTLQLFTFTAALLLAWGCGNNNTIGPDPDPDPVEMTLRWDGLTHFDLSDIGRIDVTTAKGTQRCDVESDGRFYMDDATTPIESVTVCFTEDRGSIRVDGSEVTVSENVLAIERDLSDATFVYDRATLEKVGDDLAGNYLQIRDIDLSTGGNWTPIGSLDDPFSGTYDGGGLAIRGMTVDVYASGSVFAGLFGYSRGTLRDIHIDGGSVSGEAGEGADCGGVCGYNLGGTIAACSNSGGVSGKAGIWNANCGGVCGHNEGTITACSNSGGVSGKAGTGSADCGGVCGRNEGAITACHNTGEVSGESENRDVACGGVCGSNAGNGTITACSNAGKVSGEAEKLARCGGVCAYVSSGAVIACHNTGEVSGKSETEEVCCGGVCGNSFATIIVCYNTGEVDGTTGSGTAYCGGVCGASADGTIDASYNTGEVDGIAGSGTAYCGGVCGYHWSNTFADCYWGGAGASLDGIAGGDDTAGATKFGADAWPAPTMPGWGDTAPAAWNPASLGAWTNPWADLGGWNGGGNNAIYPTLK